MLSFERNELPLVGDGALVLLCLIANQVLSADDKNNLNEILYDRFIEQGFDEARSKRIAKLLSDAINPDQGMPRDSKVQELFVVK